MSVALLACMVAVASFYHLPPRVLPAIERVEGGSIGAVHGNADGSVDLGLMQINSRWLAPLAQYTAQPTPVLRARLVGDGCFNIAVAAAILRIELNETGGDLMQAIGDYHSHTPELNAAYQAAVRLAAARLFDGGR
jgi:hypothetical protein